MSDHDTLKASAVARVRPARSEPSAPPAGLIDETYEIRRPLGEGGMGAVWLARDVRLERDVAVKVVRDDLCKDPELRARLLTEAQAMAAVRHENVVSIYAFGEHQSRPYIVMEYVEGESVSAVAERSPGHRLPLELALHVIDGAARGLQAIHDAGAVHRDVKPGNLLLARSGRVALTDFGLAMHPEQLEPFSGRIEGTLDYLAPEYIAAAPGEDPRHPAADVYALAVTAFELLTGQTPFESHSRIEALSNALHRTPGTASEVRPDLPAAFDAPLRAALEKDPVKRTASAEDFRQQIAEAHRRGAAVATTQRFLVVDDDPDFLDLLVACFADAYPDAVVDTFEDPREALQAARTVPYTLAFVDLQMPVLNGVEWVAAVRTEAEWDLPIIVLSATGSASDWQVLSKLGARTLLLKPIDPETIIAVTERTLSHPSSSGTQPSRTAESRSA